MLSQKCKYALRTILFLAADDCREKKKGVKEISDTLKIPSPFLGKILQELVRDEFISSAKGPNGGFFLTEKNLTTIMLNIVEAIDGINFFDECGIGLSNCNDDKPCPMHNSYKSARDSLKLSLNKSVAQLAQDIKDNDLFLVR